MSSTLLRCSLFDGIVANKHSLALSLCVEYLCHVYVRRDGISGIVVADQEYPPRVAFALLNKLIDEYDKEQRCVCHFRS